MKRSLMAQIPVILVCMSVLALSGCSGYSLDYILARARERMSSQPERPAVQVTAAPELVKVVTLQPSTSTQPAGDPAADALRAFANQPFLAVTYQKAIENPDAGGRKTLIYLDDQGAEYWVDDETLHIVRWMPQVLEAAGPEITSDRLRQAAVGFARAKSPVFNQRFDRLSLLQTTQGSLSDTFRWDDPDSAGRFLEVVLRLDGQVLGYRNTLDILEN